MCASELDRSNESGMTWVSLLGESASPFIDERDGLTSERERVRMLLILVAHAGGYMIMVGTHNTVGCQMHMGGSFILVWVWQMSVPAYTVDAQRHVRSFTICTRYGKSRRPQHCRCPEACGGHLPYGSLMAPTIL